MKHLVIALYSFDELDQKEQEKVIDKQHYANVSYDWWKSTYDDAETIGMLIKGFDTDRANFIQTKFLVDARTVADNIIANHGDQCGTYKTAKKFLEDSAELERKYSRNPQDTEEQADHEEAQAELDVEFEQLLGEDYLIMLRKEYEYLTSREAIVETIEANGWHFDKNGDIKGDTDADFVFPNGFESWYETYFQAVEDVKERSQVEGSNAWQVSQEEGSAGLWLLAKELTDTFEEKYRGHSWENGTYYETIDQFFQEANHSPKDDIMIATLKNELDKG